MPAVKVSVSSGPRIRHKQAMLTLLGRNGERVVLPITSPAATYSNLEQNWQELDRPGRRPLNMHVGGKLRTIQLNVTLAAADGGTRDFDNIVETKVRQLTRMCNWDSRDQAVALTYGAYDSSTELTATGHWHIDSFVLDSTWRQESNNISQATATVTLKEVSDPPAANNQNPGWTAPPAAPTYTTGGGKPQTVRYWTVKQGDTLYKIARAVYGKPEPGWRSIASANFLSNPARDLQPGSALLIPPNP